MKLPQLYLRDLFWLVLVVGLALCWWLENSRARKLGMEVKYLKSVVRPVSFIETPLEDAIQFLGFKHGIRIDVDWKSLKTGPKTLMTHNLTDGSLTYQLNRLFAGREEVDVVPTAEGIRVTTKNAGGTDVLELPPHVRLAEQRLDALLRAIDAEGYRVTFKNAAQPGQEAVILERVADP
jgi:hypothetical protein